MPITTDVRKFGDTLVAQSKTTITESTKPLYAIAGSGDLAVEKLRESLTKVQTRGNKLQERIVALPQEYKNLPETAKTLPTKVKTYADTFTGKATEVYGDLSERGEKLVAQIRRRPATKKAGAQNKQAVRSAKGSKTSATKAVKATAEATTEAASQIG